MRGKQATKRKIDPDPKYNNLLVAKLINRVMEKGKKFQARKIVYQALEIIDQKIKNNEIENLGDIKNSVELFDQAIKNIAPVVEVKGRRIGGANYQIPIQVRGDRRYFLAFSWLLTSAKSRKGKPISEKLALEIIEAFNNTGESIRVKDNIQRMAEANRAFAHFAR